jgi:hypothetical protein
MSAPILLTEAEAARLIHVSPRTLRALRSRGEIRYVRPSPRKVFYTAEDCAEFIASRTRQDDPVCPSTSPRKARASTTTSNGAGSAIMDRLAARPGGMPNGLKLISGGKSR